MHDIAQLELRDNYGRNRSKDTLPTVKQVENVIDLAPLPYCWGLLWSYC
jgi:hypothetical protein